MGGFARLKFGQAQAGKVNITQQNEFTWRLKKIQDGFSDEDANIKLWPYLVFSSLSAHPERLFKSARRS